MDRKQSETINIQTNKTPYPYKTYDALKKFYLLWDSQIMCKMKENKPIFFPKYSHFFFFLVLYTLMILYPTYVLRYPYKMKTKTEKKTEELHGLKSTSF